MFQIGLMIHNHPYFKNKNNEEICEWIRDQLAKNHFYTKPIGSNWGVLIKNIDNKHSHEVTYANK